MVYLHQIGDQQARAADPRRELEFLQSDEGAETLTPDP
jgi:hypothetical protein